jgi:exodeoxyribonuclease V alpha subunit
MPAKLQEITATYLRERHRFAGTAGDTIIGDAVIGMNGSAEPVAIKGIVTNDDTLDAHQVYRFYGIYQAYKNKRTGTNENQFVFRTFVRSTPHSRAGVVGYLEKAPGIGRVLAGRLFDKFQSNAVKILREEPFIASLAVERLSDDAAVSASSWLKSQQELEDCTIQLIDLLGGRGFRKSLAKSVVGEWGNKAASIIRRSAYSLMRFPGVGFKRCDQLYIELGGNPNAIKRQALAATYTVQSNTNGDSWHYQGVAEAGVKASVGAESFNWKKAGKLALRGKLLSSIRTNGIDGPPHWDGDVQWLAESRKAWNELRVAKFVAAACSESPFPVAPLFSDPVTEHQTQKLIAATSGGAIGMLGGSPGTGKTFVAAAYIKLVASYEGYGNIAVASPTGKASVRISEAMAANGVRLRAKTIHSLLGLVELNGRDGSRFKHDESDPLPYRLIVVDESSMIDTDLMAALLAARGKNCCVLFIGDQNQLAPVGHGAPLRDMIAAGLPYGELREIKRNDGGIAQACADMRDGKPFWCGGNLWEGRAASVESQIQLTLDLLSKFTTTNGVDPLITGDPVWDCQVLVPCKKGSPLRTGEINKALQPHLNRNPAIEGSPFRLADKVINTRNRFYPAVESTPGDANDDWKTESSDDQDERVTNERGDIYVANGEIGCVTRIESKYFEVLLFNPRREVRVPRGAAEVSESDDETNEDEKSGTGCDWDLAYALTVHKSQGSEWKHIIVLIDEYPGAKRLCDRSLIYTAISRAKETCSLIGRLETAQSAARVNNIDRRKTFLTYLIGEQIESLNHQNGV